MTTAFLGECWSAPTVYRGGLFDGQVALVAGGGSGTVCWGYCGDGEPAAMLRVA